MTSEQFDSLCQLMRTPPNASAGAVRAAARMVLVDGASQSSAASKAGVSPQSLNNAIGRLRRTLALAEIAAGKTWRLSPK